MSEEVIYPTLMAIPRPKLGAAVYRRTLVNLYEEALVVSVVGPEPDSPQWTATLMTKNGLEFVSGDVEHRTVYNWMPVGWVFDREKGGWVAPKEALRSDDDDSPVEIPEEAMEAALKNTFMLPEPWANEKFMSWRSRALKSVPQLKESKAATSVLSKAWKEKDYRAVL